MFRNRTRAPEPTESVPAEDQAAEVVPDDLAAAAEDCARQAAGARERAQQGHEEAAAVVAKAEREAAEHVAAVRGHGRGIAAQAADAGRQAADLEARSRSLLVAAARQAQGRDADKLASDLEAEREHLDGLAAGLQGKLDRLAADRADADGQLASAREAGDLEAITALLGRIGGIDDLSATLEDQRDAAQVRLVAIGDGAGPGELAGARTAADQHHQAVRRILNDLYPDRPEAVRDRAANELRLTLEGNLQRIAEESQPPGQPRTIVMQ